LGMKQNEIEHIMATATENAKKNIQNTAGSFFASLRDGAGGGGLPGGGGFPGGGPGFGGGQEPFGGLDGGIGGGRGGRGGQGRGSDAGGRGGQGGGVDGGGRGGRGGFGEALAGLSDEQRQQAQQLIRQAFQNQGAQVSPEDRQKMIQDIVNQVKSGAPGGAPAASGRGGAGGGATPNLPGGDQIEALLRRAGSSQYSDQDREKSKLPLPPEQDSQVQLLLRPGLLSDVEIEIERIPNALHLPAQAIFQKNGKPTVFVEKNGKFEPRVVQLLKQSESLMVLASGVTPGEVVALADPTAKKTDKNDEKKSQGNAMGGLPGGK
jgi:hypothetical protein